jgi:hypothetical protein
MIGEVVWPRYDTFTGRIEQRLTSLAATGQPELPRLVGQTLRLVNLLRDAWTTTPPPALEIGRPTDTAELVLHGEPYARYTLQYRDNLGLPGWTTTTLTNLHDTEQLPLPVSAPQRFYRALLPAP